MTPSFGSGVGSVPGGRRSLDAGRNAQQLAAASQLRRAAINYLEIIGGVDRETAREIGQGLGFIETAELLDSIARADREMRAAGELVAPDEVVEIALEVEGEVQIRLGREAGIPAERIRADVWAEFKDRRRGPST